MNEAQLKAKWEIYRKEKGMDYICSDDEHLINAINLLLLDMEQPSMRTAVNALVILMERLCLGEVCHIRINHLIGNKVLLYYTGEDE
jgi:hypothetical protein